MKAILDHAILPTAVPDRRSLIDLDSQRLSS